MKLKSIYNRKRMYNKVCKRCENSYETPYRHSKVCPDCTKEPYWKKNK